MARIEFANGVVQIDAEIIGEALAIEPSLVQDQIRDGKITSRYECGVDADSGRHRLTFFHGNKRLSLTVDDGGNVIQRSVVNFGSRAIPGAMRRSSTPEARKPKGEQ